MSVATFGNILIWAVLMYNFHQRLGMRQQAYLALNPRTRILCFSCARPMMTSLDQIKSMGGQGGTYHTKP